MKEMEGKEKENVKGKTKLVTVYKISPIALA